MKRTGKNTAHFILLVLLMAFFLMVADIIILSISLYHWKNDITIGAETVLDHLTYLNGAYELSDAIQERIETDDLFVMILGNDGEIIWSERLPEELKKQYTMQDVALFTRYYLNDYPVHTYVIPEGILVIGGQKDTTWKYNLEYNVEMVHLLMKQIPILVLVNIILLITVPLFIQKKWLWRREEERTEWIAGVSHDIRTPLTLIVGNANYIRQHAHDAHIVEKADGIEKQGLRIRSLVANLNMSSKLDFGMGHYEKTDVKISALLRKILAEMINRESDGRYDFSLNIDNELQELMVKGNEELLQRMMENLLNNAIVHNPDGCNIEVHLGFADKGHKKYRLQIVDDGKGTTKETLDRLNQRKSSRLEKLGEHGIGLRLVKQIARYHAWKVTFSNHDSSGFLCEMIIGKPRRQRK